MSETFMGFVTVPFPGPILILGGLVELSITLALNIAAEDPNVLAKLYRAAYEMWSYPELEVSKSKNYLKCKSSYDGIFGS